MGRLFMLAAGFVMLAATSAFAIKYTMPLQSQFHSQGASGSVFLEDLSHDVQNQITVEVSGLKPRSVYTVWLAKEPSKDMSDIKGLGVKDYSFTTDPTGAGRFVTTISEGDLSRWDVIEIVYHPNGDPTDLNNGQIALVGNLEEY